MAGSQRDERAWVRGAQRGSDSDLESLFRHHWPRAYRAAYLVVHDAAAAEDIAQEAFLAAIRSLDRFDRRRPFGPWLHRIVVNRAIDWTRARSLRHEVGAEVEREVAPAPAEPGGPYSDDVLAALRALPRDPRGLPRAGAAPGRGQAADQARARDRRRGSRARDRADPGGREGGRCLP